MTHKYHFLLGVSATAMAMNMAPAYAQDTAAASDAPIEEVVTVGTRSAKPRTATDSTVPVDAFSGEQFNSLGNASDLTDNLKMLVPSYTATPATGDGSAFVRPTSLRGLAPDQTLVLVNGKRRHRSALLHFFAPAAGNGAHGADIGMIPSIALKRVEVLRDGAAAQYGNDAISGVINFVTRDDREGGEVVAQYGQFYEGESSWKIAANAGLPLGDTGFFNISAEYTDNEALSRGIQRPDAQALIDAGVPGVGADSPFGDEPLVQTWGRPETSGARLFINSGVELTENAEWYLHGNYSETDGRYRFFYRSPTHSTLSALAELGFNGLPAGFTPYLDGAQKDISIVSGVKGEMNSGWIYDVSLGYGKNDLDYFLNNTINQSLGLSGGQPAQRDFDVGDLAQKEFVANADFSKAVSENLNFAFGFQYHKETYEITPGEPNSYEGAGSSGFKGYLPENSGSFNRNNWAVYADVEHDISDAFLMQYALRYEDYSDFGGTLNGKVAGRYKVTDTFTLRASVSTGFHAPSPGQQNVSATITTFDGTTGLQVEEGLLPATDPLAIQYGGGEMTYEESLNFSAGFTSDIGENTTLTFDVFRIDLDDRIYRTGDIQTDTGQTISFFTNSFDMVSKGFDLVLTSGFNWSEDASTDVSLAMGYNKVNVTDQRQVSGVQPVSDSIIEDIENNYPNLRFSLTTNTEFAERWNFMVRANYYGSHYDERGTINPAFGSGNSAKIGATIYFDAELGFQMNENVRFTAGLVNMFDSYVDELGPPNDNRLSVGLPYPRRSAANYEGGSWYLRAQYRF